MAKVILVRDEPINCFHCESCGTDSDGNYLCVEKGKRITAEDIQDWCPLIPEPERRKNGEAIGYKDGEPLTDELVAKLIDFGFNECLDEIEMIEEKNE